jgi:hypothetical protein
MLRFLSVLAMTMALAGQPTEQELAHIASLHRSVYELPTLPSSPVPSAARELGLRYLEGRGVERDRIQGCALLEISIWDSATTPREDAAARAEAERLKTLHCSGLSVSENEETWRLAACGIFGVTPQTIVLGPASQIDIGRVEMVLDTPAGQKKNCGAAIGCGNQVAFWPRARRSTCRPTCSRHLIELAEWASAPSATKPPGLLRCSTSIDDHWSIDVLDSPDRRRCRAARGAAERRPTMQPRARSVGRFPAANPSRRVQRLSGYTPAFRFPSFSCGTDLAPSPHPEVWGASGQWSSTHWARRRSAGLYEHSRQRFVAKFLAGLFLVLFLIFPFRLRPQEDHR